MRKGRRGRLGTLLDVVLLLQFAAAAAAAHFLGWTAIWAFIILSYPLGIIGWIRGFKQVWGQLRADFRAGRPPFGPLLHLALLVVAIPLLILPGPLTQLPGLLLLLRPVRVGALSVAAWYFDRADPKFAALRGELAAMGQGSPAPRPSTKQLPPHS